MSINKYTQIISFLLLLLSTSLTLANNQAQQCKTFYDLAEYKKALEPCTEAAKQKNLAAQTILGEILDNGSAGIQDQQQAKHWWEQAAREDYLEAINFLALKYYYGGTIFEQQPFWPQNYPKALAIWTKSAKKGIPASQFMVGEMHRLGQGTKVNLIEAYAWYKLAVDGKYGLAQELIHETLKQLKKSELEAASQLYKEYKTELNQKNK